VFRNSTADVLLLLYRNSPCVVIGRNQNPWKEVNLRKLYRSRCSLLRRRSGGGTVYHDLGNANYCVMMDRKAFDMNANARMMIEALHRLGRHATLSDRHDILWQGEKVSGTAYKITRDRAYHHGTMLLDSNVHLLKNILQSDEAAEIITKGVESTKSPVTNLKLDFHAFVKAATSSFQDRYGAADIVEVVEEDLGSESQIQDIADELQTWDWTFGQTPEFHRDLQIAGTSIRITAKRGHIIDISRGQDLEYAVGKRYHSDSFNKDDNLSESIRKSLAFT